MVCFIESVYMHGTLIHQKRQSHKMSSGVLRSWSTNTSACNYCRLMQALQVFCSKLKQRTTPLNTGDKAATCDKLDSIPSSFRACQLYVNKRLYWGLPSIFTHFLPFRKLSPAFADVYVLRTCPLTSKDIRAKPAHSHSPRIDCQMPGNHVSEGHKKSRQRGLLFLYKRWSNLLSYLQSVRTKYRLDQF